MNRIIVGLPLACDYIPTDAPQNEFEKSPTVCRINECLKRLKEIDPEMKKSQIVLTAGYTKASPSKRPEGIQHQTALCDQMRDYITYITSTYGKKFRGIHSGPMGWGTEAEIRNGIKLMQAGLGDVPVILVVSTNLAHLFRTAIYVWKYLPKGWDVWLVRAKHDFSFKSCLREIPGFFHALFFTLKFKLLGK